MDREFYVASQDRDGGILRCAIDAQGCVRQRDFYPLDRVAWLASAGNRLYALMREPFMMQSGIAEFETGADGKLRRKGEIMPVHGTVAAHLLPWKGRLYSANYLSGTVTLMPDRLIAFGGRGPDPRQECSHPHCMIPAPDGKHVCICDLGADRIYVCTPELERLSELEFKAGSGPRHMLFSKDGRFAWCSLELCSETAALEYSGGRLELRHRYSTLPDGFGGENSAAAIRMSADGKTLYVSNRGHGSVCVYNVDGAELSPAGWVRCAQGASLREINIVGDWLLCADETGNMIYVFRAGDCVGAEPVSRFAVKRPWSILPG